ncbi:MAG: hypothetical protein UY48_C0005G0040 [Candidatus Gottesmanbacteria bacterium GW2011_GWB1_49_7]|uniref:Uncharacterized protein n=1 Tax=Candidatus Gottesmanbacteria bacterium GW2011_GWB1_49_7 TaxID=1618448 RepID=A0A0G1Z2T2_9BACT|nr:MAG: hypothetical protein UY48_C0005G0040 [Candidatus Gottesmanbacteria bacterium GW2011_GWB1_49_7]
MDVRVDRSLVDTPKGIAKEADAHVNLGAWPKPPWLQNGRTPIPEEIYYWAQRPCDLLFFGQSCNLITLALLLERLHPDQQISQVDAEELDPYPSFTQRDEIQEAWGAPLPTAPILFILDITGDIKPATLRRCQNLILARRGRRLLTIAHSPLSHAEWVAKVHTPFKFIISDGSRA